MSYNDLVRELLGRVERLEWQVTQLREARERAAVELLPVLDAKDLGGSFKGFSLSFIEEKLPDGTIRRTPVEQPMHLEWREDLGRAVAVNGEPPPKEEKPGRGRRAKGKEQD